jgi:hypothetical protein
MLMGREWRDGYYTAFPRRVRIETGRLAILAAVAGARR